MIPPDKIPLAAQYITREKPFGPTNAEKVADPDMAKLFFDKNNRIWDEFQKKPIVIVGRRGSGKTAYLHSILYENSQDLRFEVDTEKIFTRALATMNDMLAGCEFPEHIAGVWETIFYLVIFSELVKQEDKLETQFPLARDYLGKLGVREPATR